MDGDFGSISIGGDLSEEKIDELKTALTADCHNLSGQEFSDLNKFINHLGHVHVSETIDRGEFDNTEEFCRKNGLMYRRKSDATDEYDAVLSCTFPKGIKRSLFPSKPMVVNGCVIWEYVVDREDNILQDIDTLSMLKQAVTGIKFKDAPKWVNHEYQVIRDYAKALLEGKDLEFIKKKLLEDVAPSIPALPPFRVIKSKLIKKRK